MATQCDVFRHHISALLDDELSETEKRQLRLHMSECDKCAAEYKSMKEADLLVKYAEVLKPTSRFWKGLREGLDKADQQRLLKEGRIRPRARIETFLRERGKKLEERLKVSWLYPVLVYELPQASRSVTGVPVSAGISRGPRTRRKVARKTVRFVVASDAFVDVTIDKARNEPFCLLVKVIKKKPLGDCRVSLCSSSTTYNDTTVHGTGCALFPAVESGRYEAVVAPPGVRRGKRKWRFEIELSETTSFSGEDGAAD